MSTRISSLNGKILPAEPLPNLAKKALNRLGVKTVPTKAEQDYAEGRTTQVPTGRMIGVTDRVSRKIGYNNAKIYYERTPPERIRGGRFRIGICPR